MFLQFAAENFRSIAQRVQLSMRVSAVVEDASDPTLISLSSHLQLLRCGALYGANASGKSNLVDAMSFAQELIVNSPLAKGAAIPISPFRLEKVWLNRPSVFEFYIFVAGHVYGYQFSVTSHEVISERLVEVSISNPTNETVLFRREGKEFTLTDELLAAVKDPGYLDYVAKGTRANQLFLNEAHERTIDALEPIYQWFATSLIIVGPNARYWPLVEEADREPAFKAFLRDVLEWADTGIVSVETRRSELRADIKKEINAFRKNKRVRALLRTLQPKRISREKLIEHPSGEAEVLSIHFRHRATEASDECLFDVEHESDGTIRLLDLAPMLYSANNLGAVYIVDEIDRSLHTLLAQRLIERFIGESNAVPLNSASQLFFTTHDTNLLDCRKLRADGIWFAEKNRSGASEFYSLAEFKPDQLQAMDGDLEQGYLRGRFGGIPFLGDPKKLGWHAFGSLEHSRGKK